jgi:adenylate kinase family enzyme
VGCSGGGKSTLSRILGERLGLPVVHLDTLFWRPGWIEAAPDEFRGAVEAVAAGERWVTDGNFTGASALRFSRAQAIVWVDQPRLLCLRRVIWRSARSLGRIRADLAPGCPERFDLEFWSYIWTWNRRTRPKMERAIATHGPQARLIRLVSDAEIAGFLADLGQFLNGQGNESDSEVVDPPPTASAVINGDLSR